MWWKKCFSASVIVGFLKPSYKILSSRLETSKEASFLHLAHVKLRVIDCFLAEPLSFLRSCFTSFLFRESSASSLQFGHIVTRLTLFGVCMARLRLGLLRMLVGSGL